MKKSYGSGLATHIGSESCGAARKGSVEALTGERAGRVFSRVSSFRHRRTSLDFPMRPKVTAALGGLGISRFLREVSAYASLSSPPHGRRHLRQEPDAVAPLVQIRGGGCERS
jgi:hypothetical protein